MPRFIVPPKYIYSAGTQTQELQLPMSPGYAGNGMFCPLVPVTSGNIVAPVPILPIIGNGHDCRTHSKITVTTIRMKMTIQLNPKLIQQGTTFNDELDGVSEAADYLFPTTTQWPRNPNQFYKCRYMMVEFDEDLAITYEQIYSWFYSTFCFYREASQTPQQQLPTEEVGMSNTIPGPISVHSNILRITTPWIGKFKILADKCFEITSNRPRVSIDLTIPINRVYTWNDEVSSYDQSTELITPHIYAFILPPLSYEQDVGTWDTYQINSYLINNSTARKELYTVDWWCKLNFIDI